MRVASWIAGSPDRRIAGSSALLAVVLGTALTSKLFVFDELAGVIAASGLIPKEFSRAAGIGLLLIEATILTLLVSLRFRRFGLLASAGLLSIFGAYHGWRWHEGISVPCTCFGPLFKITAPVGLALCSGLLLIAHFGLVPPAPKPLNSP